MDKRWRNHQIAPLICHCPPLAIPYPICPKLPKNYWRNMPIKIYGCSMPKWVAAKPRSSSVFWAKPMVRKCEQLGVQDHISSPTYALVNEYHTDKPITIYHIDLYRLKNLEEALHIGIEDYLYQPNSYCFIEWYALIKPILPPQCLLIQIERLPDGNRQLTSSIL